MDEGVIREKCNRHDCAHRDPSDGDFSVGANGVTMIGDHLRKGALLDAGLFDRPGFPTITEAAREAEELAKVGTAMPQLEASVETLTNLCRRAARGAGNPEQPRGGVRMDGAA